MGLGSELEQGQPEPRVRRKGNKAGKKGRGLLTQGKCNGGGNTPALAPAATTARTAEPSSTKECSRRSEAGRK